jgi:hypothetical protein
MSYFDTVCGMRFWPIETGLKQAATIQPPTESTEQEETAKQLKAAKEQ